MILIFFILYSGFTFLIDGQRHVRCSCPGRSPLYPQICASDGFTYANIHCIDCKNHVVAECEGKCPCNGRTMPQTEESVFEEEGTEESEDTEGSGVEMKTDDINSEMLKIHGGQLYRRVARRKMNSMSSIRKNKYYLIKV